MNDCSPSTLLSVVSTLNSRIFKHNIKAIQFLDQQKSMIQVSIILASANDVVQPKSRQSAQKWGYMVTLCISKFYEFQLKSWVNFLLEFLFQKYLFSVIRCSIVRKLFKTHEIRVAAMQQLHSCHLADFLKFKNLIFKIMKNKQKTLAML